MTILLRENKNTTKTTPKIFGVRALFFCYNITYTKKRALKKWSIGREPPWSRLNNGSTCCLKVERRSFRGSSSNTRINDRGIMGKGPIMERYR